jgi:hypothetical protein
MWLRAYREGMDVPDLRERQSGPRPQVMLGLMVMLLGGMLFFKQLDSWWGFEFNVHIWPFIVIFMGLARLGDPALATEGRPGAYRPGVWLLLVGFWGLLNEYRLFGFHYGTSWPVLVVFAGFMIVWRAVDPIPAAPVAPREP